MISFKPYRPISRREKWRFCANEEFWRPITAIPYLFPIVDLIAAAPNAVRMTALRATERLAARSDRKASWTPSTPRSDYARALDSEP